MLRNARSSVVAVRQEETPNQLRLHRFAVQLFQSAVERYGIDHEEAELALRLVEATNPGDTDVAVLVGSVPER
jgi:hypothetical protein